MDFPESLHWRDDGHAAILRIEADRFIVVPDRCPKGNHVEAECHHPVLGACLVRHFIQVYGLDINLSSASPKELMRLVWAWDGNPADIDSDTCYIMFKEDSRVAEWISAEREESEIG